jgi:hypothetical protein
VNFAAFRADLAHGANGAAPACGRVGRAARRRQARFRRRFLPQRRQKAVPAPAHRLDEARVGGVLVQRFADARQAEIDTHVELAGALLRPEGGADVVPAHHLARARGQQIQQAAGLSLQADQGAVAPQLIQIGVELVQAEPQTRRRRGSYFHGRTVVTNAAYRQSHF